MRQFAALEAQQAHQALRVGRAALHQIPVPHATATAVQCQAQAVFAAHQRRARGADLAHVEQQAYQVRRRAAGGGDMADVAQHGQRRATVGAQAQALALVVVDAPIEQLFKLLLRPRLVVGHHPFAEVGLQHGLGRHGQPLAQAVVGPEDAQRAQLDACDARGRMAGDLGQLLRQCPARGLGRAHAPQQPPCQHASEEHVEPALDGLAACQPQRVGDEHGQQRVAQGHPDRAHRQVEQHAPPRLHPQPVLRCVDFH